MDCPEWNQSLGKDGMGPVKMVLASDNPEKMVMVLVGVETEEVSTAVGTDLG